MMSDRRDEMNRNQQEDQSRERILRAAEEEFLEKGFEKASLRNISRNAGVTTGSLYWHFQNKEELFEALTGEHYRFLMNMYRDAQQKFFEMSPKEQMEHIGEAGDDGMEVMIEYIYQHKTGFKLLTDCAAGTRYENMIHELTEAEIASTHRFTENIKELGAGVDRIRPELEHILVSGMLTSMFELVIHDVPLEIARECARDIHAFYTAGWKYLVNLPKQ